MRKSVLFLNAFKVFYEVELFWVFTCVWALDAVERTILFVEIVVESKFKWLKSRVQLRLAYGGDSGFVLPVFRQDALAFVVP